MNEVTDYLWYVRLACMTLTQKYWEIWRLFPYGGEGLGMLFLKYMMAFRFRHSFVKEMKSFKGHYATDYPL